MRHFSEEKIAGLFELPFFNLIDKARRLYRKNFPVQGMQLCALANIKTGACPEDCAYCPQSGHYNTGLEREPLWDAEAIVTAAKIAKANGAVRFCLGAAWRSPPKKIFPRILDVVKKIKSLGLESCITVGMLTADQAQQLKEVGLDFYNHNLDTSPEYYRHIVTTRQYQERLDTISHVINAGLQVCCGGILGMGEARKDRVRFLKALSDLPKVPESIPINQLIPIKGTPLEDTPPLDEFEFIRTVAVTRILFPGAKVRLSAGRKNMSATMQAWCFMAGANSIFIGDKLLTAENPSLSADKSLLEELGIPTNVD